MQLTSVVSTQKGDGSEGARIIQVYDAEMQALQSTKNSSKMLEEAYATGVAILTKYSEQGDRLKVLIHFSLLMIRFGFLLTSKRMCHFCMKCL